MDIKTLVLVVTLVLATSIGNNKVASLAGDKPLHLTPLVYSGELLKARNLSLVIDAFIPRSHAGLITVDRRLGNNLFFWLFPAEKSDPKSPLVIWLNGPSGISSLFGLLYGNGPIRYKSHYNNMVELERIFNSWTQNFNMLYIDSIIGVGYSHTNKDDGYKVPQDSYSEDLYSLLIQFYHMFPEYMKVDLYIGGEDHAGKSVPDFAHHLHTKIVANRTTVPLKGIYLGSPLFDEQTQFREAAKLYEALGVISPKQAEDFRTEFDEFVKLGNYSNMYTHDLFNKLFPDVGTLQRAKENFLTLETSPYFQIESVMLTDIIRDAVHMGNLTYNLFSLDAYSSIGQYRMVNTTSKLATLMDNYKVLIYNGDLDGHINSIMIEAGLMSIKWKSQTTYNNSTRIVWGLKDKPKGHYTQTGQFCRVVIRSAGHEPLRDQPEVSREMMEQFVKSGCIQQN